MEQARVLIDLLEKAGHKTYIVGGAVRDKLLGIAQHDIDIVTLAHPDEICAVAESNNWKSIQVGRAFGVITVVVEGQAFEVATARSDHYGHDSHRPEEVNFIRDIREDLARRDFTVNAMAMDSSGEVIDPFEGQIDLEKKIIRAVGNPMLRFAEDGLRPFRAVRFAAQLGFTIESKTLSAIPATLYRIKGLSVERVCNELEKILLAPNAGYGLDLLAETGLAGCSCTLRSHDRQEYVGLLDEILHLRGLEQNPRHHRLDAWEHTLAAVDAVPRERVLRWAALLHDAGKGTEGIRGYNKQGELADPGHARASAKIARKILSRLKVPRSVLERVVWLVENHMSLPPANRKSVVKWLKKRAWAFPSRQEMAEAVRQLLTLSRADISAGKVNPNLEAIDAIEILFTDILTKVPFYPADLAIEGKEVALNLGAGPQVKEFLNTLIERVQKGELDNDIAILRQALARRVERVDSRT